MIGVKMQSDLPISRGGPVRLDAADSIPLPLR
jgi:hypothetical protein